MARFSPISAHRVAPTAADHRADDRPATADPAPSPDPSSTSHRPGRSRGRSWRSRNHSVAVTVTSLLLLLGLGHANRQDLATSLPILADLAPLPFLLAIAISVAAMINRAGQFRSAHRFSGIDTDLRSMARISASGYAINKVVKSGGLGGMALFVRHGRQRGLAPGSVLAAYALSALGNQLALVASVALAVIALSVSAPTLGPLAATAAAVALLILFGLFTIGAVCLRSRAIIERLYRVPFAAAERVTGRFGWRSPARPDPAHLDRFFEVITTLRRRPAAAFPVLAHALTAKLLGATMLTAVVAAVGAEVEPLAALVIYTMALVAAASTFLPGGLGAVEATMTLMLTGHGVPVAPALATTITFRLLDMWLPIVVGILAAPGLDRSTERSRRRDRARAETRAERRSAWSGGKPNPAWSRPQAAHRQVRVGEPAIRASSMS